MEQKAKELTPREGFTRGSLVLLYMLTITLLVIGLSIWLYIKSGLPGFIVLGVITSQVLMLAGICGIILWRREPKKEV